MADAATEAALAELQAVASGADSGPTAAAPAPAADVIADNSAQLDAEWEAALQEAKAQVLLDSSVDAGQAFPFSPTIVPPNPNGLVATGPASVHVSNLQDETSPEELYEMFGMCGEIKKITIKVDRTTGARLGYGYIDFAEAKSVDDALLLDGSPLRGQELKVNRKKTDPSGCGKWGGKSKGKGWGGFQGGKSKWGAWGKGGGDKGWGWGPY